MWNQQPQPDLGMILGRLLERTEATLINTARIDRRLEQGDARLEALNQKLEAVKEARRSDPIPGLEKAIKAAVPYIIGLLVLIVTGKAELALQIMQGGGK